MRLQPFAWPQCIFQVMYFWACTPCANVVTSKLCGVNVLADNQCRWVFGTIAFLLGQDKKLFRLLIPYCAIHTDFAK